MARKVRQSSYAATPAATGKYEDGIDDDGQEDLYANPYGNNSRQPSSTPAPHASSNDPSISPSPASGSFSDKENAPSKSRHRGSDRSPLVKKERGLIAQSARSTPYADAMPSRTSRVSAGPLRPSTSQLSVRNSITKSRSHRSQTSRTLSRGPSAVQSRASSRATSAVPETPVSEQQDDEDDAMENGSATNGAEAAGGEEEEEDDDDDEEEEEYVPATQRSRISETPEPSRPSRHSLSTQAPPSTQVPSSSQRPEPTQFYDPNQSMAERRRVKGAYNDIQQELVDNRENFLKSGNQDLIHYLKKTGDLFTNVKQTSDAMVDGKVQVEIGKIAAEKAKRVGNSNTNTGLDMDEFISKCIQFMAKSRPGDSGDGHDWSYMGREAATPSLKRAMPSDFMYGPIGIQKRQRVLKERKRAVRRRPEEYIRPIDLDEKAIARNENSTTKNVILVNECLENYISNLDEDEGESVNYFKFVINPHSYSQTIENMFYLAFLVRDGRAAIQESEDGLPYVCAAEPPTPEEASANQMVRKQIVMPMEKKVWRELIEVFQITDTIIPTRPREVEAINASGWYS
ncbi:hypothetical protein AA313_de0204685 [Arthrobotrys entomopaga]|nr:hypothetical protein AA313_de0204685 [Arthrobotrys entomopaga]